MEDFLHAWRSIGEWMLRKIPHIATDLLHSQIWVKLEKTIKLSRSETSEAITMKPSIYYFVQFELNLNDVPCNHRHTTTKPTAD